MFDALEFFLHFTRSSLCLHQIERYTVAQPCLFRSQPFESLLSILKDVLCKSYGFRGAIQTVTDRGF